MIIEVLGIMSSFLNNMKNYAKTRDFTKLAIIIDECVLN